MRLGVCGTRVVAVVDAQQVGKYLQKVGILGIRKEDYLNTAQQDTMNKIFDRGVSMYHRTLGVGDERVLPCHAIVFELIT